MNEKLWREFQKTEQNNQQKFLFFCVWVGKIIFKETLMSRYSDVILAKLSKLYKQPNMNSLIVYVVVVLYLILCGRRAFEREIESYKETLMCKHFMHHTLFFCDFYDVVFIIFVFKYMQSSHVCTGRSIKRFASLRQYLSCNLYHILFCRLLGSCFDILIEIVSKPNYKDSYFFMFNHL